MHFYTALTRTRALRLWRNLKKKKKKKAKAFKLAKLNFWSSLILITCFLLSLITFIIYSASARKQIRWSEANSFLCLIQLFRLSLPMMWSLSPFRYCLRRLDFLLVVFIRWSIDRVHHFCGHCSRLWLVDFDPFYCLLKSRSLQFRSGFRVSWW